MAVFESTGNWISAFAPATIANVACGFDIMGFAIDEPGDIISVRKKESAGVSIAEIIGDDGKLPTGAEANTASVAVIEFLKGAGISYGVEIKIHKQIPMGSGLGSSAASPAAAVLATNELFNRPFSRKALLPFAVKGEEVASNAIHADNVGPSLLGGFTLIRGYNPIDIIHLNVPIDLACAVVLPQVEIRTSEARGMLPSDIPLKTAITQWGNVGGLVAGLQMSDYDLIGRAIQDVVAEPIRRTLIPGYESIKSAAMKAGALGCSISGSGPAVFALCKGRQTAQSVGYEMFSILDEMGVQCKLYVSSINQKGARIITT